MTSSTRSSFLFIAAASLALASSAALIAQVHQADAVLPDAPEARLAAEHSTADLGGSSSINIVVADSDLQATTPQSSHPLSDEEKKKIANEEAERELHQRLGDVVPNFNAVLDGVTVPLSPRQKMRAAFRSAIDPYQFGLAFITSGYGQATDSHSSIDPNGTRHGYGQGWAGFGERYGANYVDQFDGTIIGNGVLPVLLHQDPRYYRMGTGSFSKRFFYSLSTTVRCKSDTGKWQPSYSNILGNLVSGGISNIYYPRAERGFGLTVEQGLTVTAEGSFGALLIEFFPDIQNHFRRKHQ